MDFYVVVRGVYVPLGTVKFLRPRPRMPSTLAFHVTVYRNILGVEAIE